MATRGNRGGGGGDDGDKGKKRFTAEEKGKSPMPEEDPPESVDWRLSPGVIGPVLNQRDLAICWAIAMVRAIQALLNINVAEENQMKELSIQHVVNNVNYNKTEGIQNVRKALTFAMKKGICSSSQCSPNTFDDNVAEKFVCKHPLNVHAETIDDFVYITDMNDSDLLAIVARQPVIGILRNTALEFSEIGSRIYRSPTESGDISFHQVLIVGYGCDSNGKPYWIIQNSHGEAWGNGGFGYVYRRIIDGRGSEFYGVAYPMKRDYPRKKDGA